MKKPPMTAEPQAAREDSVPFGVLDVPAAEKAGRVRAVFDSVAENYDLMNDLMSGGLHRLWKTAAVDWLNPRPDARIIDVAGGTADIAMRIVRAAGGPQAVAAAGGAVTVIDINAAMMTVGRKRVARAGLAGTIGFACADAEALPLADASVDTYVIAFGLRNVTRTGRALAEARRVLAPGGRFLCLEFSRPRLPLIGPVYDVYSDHVLPWLGRKVAGDGEAYRYLAESIRRFPDQPRLAAMMAEAGFEQVRVRDLAGGIAAMHSGWVL
ncbi:MAG: ubiquinone/menaquinone biosynthesis C-methyltransferase UbiE [Pseudomonadota bacterium]|jgi:demethylmenaquinone methyltransferase/2-methoxy-6-polyprenyl-1,4-benzoquinol methylase